ncbi:hypothetical protein AB0I53_05570 [Saccharopolyspora sp. NPDC050389]|uniref:hypothetical protein n=1 Tax=Saccharopolyspora sp. NPDC050389 TaxID=3155516 RepID=UPI0033C42772
MLRKIAVGAAAIAGLFALSSPAMASGGPYPAGVYPSYEAAQAACDAGKAQGRWTDCVIEAGIDDPILMWVWTD